jgi:hypothetical protein
MTDSNRSANEVPALLEERRKFESWLAALEARRDTTPQHVFDRVKSDYQGRMRQVEEQLAAHRHSIQEERTSLESRRSLLEAEEQLRRDERAELELRAHVGELSIGDADSAFKAVDDALAGMKTEREGLSKRIAELDALLSLKSREPSAAESPKEVVAPAAEPAKEAEPVAEPAESEAEESERRDALHTPGGSFDELAFLSDVVGLKEGQKEEPSVERDESVSDSLLESLRPAERSSGEAPLASNVPGNTPIVLRTSGAIEQSKTLKCTECGAMNYPTEWYCERCGAELAAL